MTYESHERHDTVFDTASEHLGRVYAEALMGAAQKANVLDAVVQQLGSVVDDLLTANDQLRAVVSSPRIDPEEKVRVMQRLLEGKVDPVLMRFIKVTAERGRLGFLPDIRRALEDLHDERQGRVVAIVRSAVPLSEQMREEVANRVGNAINRSVTIREKIDPSVIGGLVIRVGDTVFDASVAGRLRKLAEKTRAGFARRLAEQPDAMAEAT